MYALWKIVLGGLAKPTHHAPHVPEIPLPCGIAYICLLVLE